MRHDDDSPPRQPLTRNRILQAAVDLADRRGLDALTMRRLGAELGVEAMALYKHVANKDDILDGIVDRIVDEIEMPRDGTGWRDAMRRRAVSAREVFRRHSWAIGLLESRSSLGPRALAYLDAVLGNLRSEGFSIEHAIHAFWTLDSYVYGHVVQETRMPRRVDDGRSDAIASDSEVAVEHPHVAAAQAHAWTSSLGYDEEFEFGLDLILDALEVTLVSAQRARDHVRSTTTLPRARPAPT